MLALFTFVYGTKDGRATSPSFEGKNGSIDASKLSLEAQMERNFMLLKGEVGHFAYEKKAICLCILHLFMAQRAIGQHRPLLQLKMQ